MSLQNNRYPVELAGELKRHVIVKVDRRAAVFAYIKTFFPIKTNGVVPALHDREVAGVFDTAATRVLLVVLKP